MMMMMMIQHLLVAVLAMQLHPACSFAPTRPATGSRSSPLSHKEGLPVDNTFRLVVQDERHTSATYWISRCRQKGLGSPTALETLLGLIRMTCILRGGCRSGRLQTCHPAARPLYPTCRTWRHESLLMYHELSWARKKRHYLVNVNIGRTCSVVSRCCIFRFQGSEQHGRNIWNQICLR